MRCPMCIKLSITEGSHFCTQSCFKASWSAHKSLHKSASESFSSMEKKKVETSLGSDSKNTLSFSPVLASFKVTPNPDESSDPNFPRNLHNAGELFLRVGHVGSAFTLHSAATKQLNILSNGPDGKTAYELGRACVCWNCGYVGLPKNKDKCKEKEVVPKGVCAKCGRDEETNFVRVQSTEGEEKELPWMEAKDGLGVEQEQSKALEALKAKEMKEKPGT